MANKQFYLEVIDLSTTCKIIYDIIFDAAKDSDVSDEDHVTILKGARLKYRQIQSNGGNN